MTVLEAFNNILIELNKVQAPSLLLDDFVYMFNKGILGYINERYNLFESKQQLTDDLRVLLKTVEIDMTGAITDPGIYGQNYKCELPSDYMHLLNCVCYFHDQYAHCKSKLLSYGANKINTDQWSLIINNYYLKPKCTRPYYYIMNLDEPADVAPSTDRSGTVLTVTGRSTKEAKLAVAGQDVRYGNSVQPVIRIVLGDDISKTLLKVYIDYLRAPIYYSLSQDEIDDVVDNSQVIEFPDYVVYEIINRIVKLILENNLNPRIQTHPAATQTIA